MSLQRSAIWSGLSLSALGSAMTAGVYATVVSAIPIQAVQVQSVSACAVNWSEVTSYNGGSVVSEEGSNFKVNWWTQGGDWVFNIGANGSGMSLKSQGAASRVGGGLGGSVGSGTHSVASRPAQPWVSLDACNGSAGGSKVSSVASGGGARVGGDSGSVNGLLFSPYKDVTINMDWNTNVMRTAVTGTPMPIVGSGSLVSRSEPKLGAITLAFASGECGAENWGGISGASFASVNIQPLVNAGLDYVVSTGGKAGLFTCSSLSGMAQFLSRYMSAHMVGLDFDIEGSQTLADIRNLISNAAYAHTLYPNLRFSFTLATLAASDGSYGGLNVVGDMVVRALKNANLPNYTINLMVMDFGSATPTVCVVADGQCNMGQSAIQAALNLEHSYGISASQIELTPMIGVNDVSSEVFTSADVDTVVSYAVDQGLAGVHLWSLDRDTACSNSATGYASQRCSSLGGTRALQYTDRFLKDLGR